MLRTYLSRIIAGKSKVWLSRDQGAKSDSDDKKVKIDIENCLNEFTQIKKWEDDARSKFKDSKAYLEITYEELVEDKDVTLGKVFDFLDVERINTSTKMKKQNPEPLSELIINYEELSKEILNSEFSYLLK